MLRATSLLPFALALGISACALETDAPDTQHVEQAIGLNPGFQHEIIATGFSRPTAMAIAPDGRVFIAQQTGQVRVVKNGQLLSAPFVSVPVDSSNERGLIGIALDPGFAANGWVYLFYTTPDGGTHNRVSRFTATGDLAATGSERVLVDFPALSGASNHNSGALHFGRDGKLYVAHGDNANDALAQDLNHPFGSILRFNPDGTIPQDNPFYELPVDTADAIWAYGLRNPFTMAVSPQSGKLFANDVGGGGPEEVNEIVRGGNYGHGGGPAPIAPVHSYPRVNRCAITGGTFYEPGVVNFPSSFVGKYFFADYCGGEIWFMNQDGSGVTSFARVGDGHLHNPVDLDVAPDGSLYYLQRGNGEKLGRIYVAQPNCSSDQNCDDENPCNGQERCVSGQCQGGAPLVCNDGDPCTNDECHASEGCRFPASGLCNCSVDADCDDGSSCTSDRCVSRMCQYASNGSCAEDVLALTHVSDGGGWNNVAALTDGNLVDKVATGVSPNCVEYALSGPHTVTSARLMEDNAGGWRVDTWKVQVDSGSGYRDAIGYSESPSAMPTWNELRFAPVSGVTRVKICMQTAGLVEAAEVQVLGRSDTGGSFCGDGTCDASEACSSCQADCGPCAPSCGDGICEGTETCGSCEVDCGTCSTGPLRLTHLGDSGGWSRVSGLTDGELLDKVFTGTSPNCVEYSLGGTYTIRAARLLEDNDGGWHVDTWKVQYDSGNGYVDAVGYSDTPRAMPSWNELDFPDVSGVTRIKVCMQNNGPIEAAELEVLGDAAAPDVCGDRVCGSSERCNTCPWDCDTCQGQTLGLDSRPQNLTCVAGASGSAPPRLLSQHPCVERVANPPAFAQGVLPYAINQAFWSDGAMKSRLFALPEGSSFQVAADGDYTLPPGAVTIKNFQWQGQYFETRFFVRHTDGSYGAYTYKWNDTQTEAELVDATLGDTKLLAGGHLWSYPTRSQCFECHNEATGFSLGLETRQLNREQRYDLTGRSANQVDTLAGVGMLSGQHDTLPPFPGLSDAQVSLELRARAYLHINCATCHRPGGPGYGLADYRYDTSVGAMRACNEPSILAAYPDQDLIEPGDHARSVVFLRTSKRGESQMPPIGSTVVDTTGAALIGEWIDSLSGCPAP